MALNADSPRTSKRKYHVFLSFRGEDTRLAFTDHLYAALRRDHIDTFRDKEELRRGEFISEQILRAIEESLIAIVILSQNYATSTWCLDELQKIVETKGSLGLVLPVFYHVAPTDVRHQTGCFAEAFRQHEKRFKEKVDKWKNALKCVANLSGFSSQDRPEAQLIDEIVEQVWTKIEPKLPSNDDDDLVAIDTKVNEVYSCLSLESKDVLFIGIWGMGGSGKTTLASVVYKKIQSQFEVHCILHVGEASEKGDRGLVNLQNKLLSHLNVKSRVIETLNQGRDSIRKLLSERKILIVLDDVSTVGQLENLAGKQEWFGQGSRIIVTTRDKHLLSSRRVFSEMYELKTLNTDESLQLFHQEAFKGEQQTQEKECLELSKKFVEYAEGLPLALKVLGSNLCTRKVDEWEDTLDKIREDQDGGIMNVLRISFDMLDKKWKPIFLDIALFFKGWYKDKVEKILENCGLNPKRGIKVLIERTLVTCNKGVLGMHNLLEDMARGIVSQESKQDLGRRSRLCSLDDIDKVLGKNMGTEKVEGMVLKQQIESYNKAARWHPRAFSKMHNLRLLIILCDLHLSCGFECLPSSLKVLIWMEYPLKALPLGVELCELVHLQMNNSKVEQLWNGSQVFEKLKVIDLSYSKYLIQAPNISDVPLLEELFLDGCVSLVEVHQSVGQHKKLAVLSLIGCIKLEILPSKLEMGSLKRLFLCGCSNMKILPDFGESMKCLSMLNLMNCSNLLCIPDTITNLKTLKLLNLSGCSKVCRLPDNINENKALEDLDLSETSIRVVDSSLFQLENLKRLSFRGCSGPVSNTSWELPLLFGLGSDVKPYLWPLELPPSVAGLSSLNIFDLSYCNLGPKSIPEDLGHLSSLKTLILSGNERLMVTDSIPKRPEQCFLEAEGCYSFVNRSVLSNMSDSLVEAGLFLDLWKFWKLFKSDDSELSCQVRDHSYPIKYIESPPNFGNEILFPMGLRLSKLESSASIIVDIPDECRTGEWWGIVVFIAFEPLESSTFPSLKFSWSFEASHPEAGPSLYLSSDAAKAHYDCCLVTMIMSDNYIYIQLHHRKYDNISESKPFSKHRKPDFSENSRLRFDVQGGELKMTECGYEVLCKEDFRSKALLNSRSRSVDKPNCGESSRLHNVEETEINGEDAMATNGENSQ